MRILGIETSCDETGAAIIEGSTTNGFVTLVSNVLATSLAKHAETGGVIPEIAARQQLLYIIPVIQEALQTAGYSVNERPPLDAIAVTYGPGLIGSLLIGVETAKTLSFLWNIPVIPVNHMYGHIYANWIITNNKLQIENKTIRNSSSPRIRFPAIGLVISGGHTDILLIKNHHDLHVIGGTRDDAAGECFDKCARLLGYSYPGGPKISQLAKKGNPKRFPLPRPMIDSHDYDYSFSGLKTAFMRLTNELFPLKRRQLKDRKGGWNEIALESEMSEEEKQKLYDICASLEYAIVDIVTRKVIKAINEYGVKTFVLSGGVAANNLLTETFRKKLSTLPEQVEMFVPPAFLCTDNAAMIAAAGFYSDTKMNWQDVIADPQLYY